MGTCLFMLLAYGTVLQSPTASAVAVPFDRLMAAPSTLRHFDKLNAGKLTDRNLRARLGFCDSPSRGE